MYGVESCKIVFLGGHFSYLLDQTLLLYHYRLELDTTMSSITDRRTDGQRNDGIMPTACSTIG